MKNKKPAQERVKRIGVNYCRYSSHNQRDASIEQQMEEAQYFAEINDIVIIETYADRATTGRSDDRRDFQRMMRDAERGKFDVVIAWKSDRMGRNMLQAMQNEARLRSLGIRCLYVEENYDDTAAGRFAQRSMMNVNQFYSESMAENITRGLQYNAENCMVTNGHLPFGYKADEDLHYAIDSPKDEIVREIFTRVSSGEPMVDIYKDLNTRGIKTSRGFEWTKSGFNSLLHNERYKGIYIYGDTRIEGGIPRIVSDELFDRVQKVLTMKKHPRGRHRSNADYLLTGKVYCGYCKDPIVGTSGKSKTGDIHYYYACSNKRKNGAAACRKKTMRKELTEEKVAEAIRTQISKPKVRAWIVDTILKFQESNRDNTEIDLINTRLSEVKTARKNVMAAIEKGIITDTTKDRLMELERENAELDRKLRQAQTMKSNEVTEKMILDWLDVLSKGDLKDKSYQEVLFNVFVTRVYLFDNFFRVIVVPFGGSDAEEFGFDGDLDDLADADFDMVEYSHKVRFAPPLGAYTNPSF